MIASELPIKLLIFAISLLHIYFLCLEMFFWTKPLGLKVFKQSFAKAKDSAALAANQGLYNGFLAAGLIWGLTETHLQFQLKILSFFLGCVIFAGIFGGITVNKRIFYIQSAPALLALIWLISIS